MHPAIGVLRPRSMPEQSDTDRDMGARQYSQYAPSGWPGYTARSQDSHQRPEAKGFVLVEPQPCVQLLVESGPYGWQRPVALLKSEKGMPCYGMAEIAGCIEGSRYSVCEKTAGATAGKPHCLLTL